jgi:hypothetical protein
LLMPDAVDTVTWAPVDGWRYHPKHVEQFTFINKLYIVASCYIFGLTNARCCVYSDMNSWWWVEIPPETYRAVYSYK